MNIPRAEHPFPQMERKTWRNLNGEWQFEFDFGNTGVDRNLYLEKSFSKKIIVPFCPESELSEVNYKDFMNAVWYKRSIFITREEKERRIILHFGAVDYECKVYVNGKHAGGHKGGYTSFSFDISALILEGDNDITVYARDNGRDGLQPRGKQSTMYYSNGCDYTRTTGIWQTVWVEFVPKEYIQKVKYYPNIKNGSLHISGLASGKGTFSAVASYNGRECGSTEIVSANGSFETDIKLSEIHLWELGQGRLYDLELKFNEDTVKSYFGLREVVLSDMKFFLNEKSVFQRLVLDQGFYQEGIYTAPTEEDLIKDIQLSMDLGFNGARLHEKVFEPRFLYHCDKMGYMVWGEMGNWGLDMSNPMALFSFLPEWMEAVERDFNHPSIVGWCPFNETWEYDGRQQINDILRIVYEYTKRADNTRPCIDTSGNYHVVTDIYDLHNYEQDVDKFKEYYEGFKTGGELRDDHSHRQKYTKGQPVFISEYGGIKWDPSISYEGGWGYGEAPKTEEEWFKRYEGLTTALLDNPKIFAFCYTQLYDIEQEVNGLYYYNREPKFDVRAIKAINSKKAAIEE
ncbi:MAG: beta-galactosidase [Anaerocolumna sp.]|jgi:beta-galactosidase/beta-glucuronidase|nr:beta-galactosidase [Anaerocolumna sp.]